MKFVCMLALITCVLEHTIGVGNFCSISNMLLDAY